MTNTTLGPSPSPPAPSPADLTRKAATAILRLPDEVVAAFRLDNVAERVNHIRSATADLILGLIPSFHWAEFNLPDAGALLRQRAHQVLDAAVSAGALHIPEYAGGHRPTAPVSEPSLGVQTFIVNIVVPAKLLSHYLLELAEEIDTRARPPAVPDVKAVWYHEDGVYSVDGVQPLSVMDEDDKILRAFLREGIPMEAGKLTTKSGVSNVPRAIRQLCKRYNGVFAPFVRSPGSRGKGGYWIPVRRHESAKPDGQASGAEGPRTGHRAV